MDIADRAGKLHDRFVEFLNHLQNLGSRLNQASRAYEDAMKAITEGRGNLIGQVKQLEKLGAKAKKSMPGEYSEVDLNEDAKGEEIGDGDNTTIQFPKTQ